VSAPFCPHCGYDLQTDAAILINDFAMMSSNAPLYWRNQRVDLTGSERIICYTLMRGFPSSVRVSTLLDRRRQCDRRPYLPAAPEITGARRPQPDHGNAPAGGDARLYMAHSMRVLVTGGRERTSFEDRMWLYAGLDLLHKMGPITEIIEGGAVGFDHHAWNWALWRKGCGDGVKHTQVKAEWEKYSAGLKHGQKNPAGAIRNAEMAKLRPDVVLACPGGLGTANMVAAAKRAGLKVILLEKMPVLPTK
jgi:hypothetical protein